MEVHHHSHTTRKKWTQYFWDFFMLFLAVTFGFLVENGREHFIEHKRAKKYLHIMLFDVQSNVHDLDSLIKENTKLTGTYDSLLQDMMHDRTTIDRYAIARRIFPVYLQLFKNRNETFEQMKTTGSLRYLDNQDLLSAIINYNRLADFTEWRAMENERKIALEQTYPLIHKSFDARCLAEEIPGRLRLMEHQDILSGDAAEKFRNDLSDAFITRLKFMTISLNTYSMLKKKSLELVTQIEAELQ